MKIKTITCHNVYNFGASLQAYALAEYLQSEGHEVEIIDYQPLYLRHYRLAGVPNPRFDRPVWRQAYQIAKFPGRLFDRITSRRTPCVPRRRRRIFTSRVAIRYGTLFFQMERTQRSSLTLRRRESERSPMRPVLP